MNNLTNIIQKIQKGKVIFLLLLAALIITIFVCINLERRNTDKRNLLYHHRKITGTKVFLEGISTST